MTHSIASMQEPRIWTFIYIIYDRIGRVNKPNGSKPINSYISVTIRAYASFSILMLFVICADTICFTVTIISIFLLRVFILKLFRYNCSSCESLIIGMVFTYFLIYIYLILISIYNNLSSTLHQYMVFMYILFVHIVYLSIILFIKQIKLPCK